MTRLLLAVLLLTLGGCSDPPPAPSTADRDELTGSTWLLTEGEGPAGSVLVADGARVTLRFDEASDQLGGVSGCNHYGAEVALDGDAIEVGGLGGTEMACEQPLMEVERRYLDALAGVDTVTVEGDVLTLTGPDARLLYDREPDAPTEALLGTTWRLESVVHGEGDAAAVSQAGDPAELRLGQGTLELQTSCVRVAAEWVEQGAEFRITSSSYEYADEDAVCLHDDPEQQRILEVFDGAFTAEVDGDLLTLHATRSDTGLQFRAEG
ncbi:META domain-containing protein [Egicoccus sp. AB-alg6-2]|uniref:META domain-containing protein n=1 Tax=Egicoccus sp. AB-alg6-2 TaxID=3242692 RepID=UPI00359E6AC8